MGLPKGKERGGSLGAVPRPNNRLVGASYVPHVANVPCTGWNLISLTENTRD